MRKQTNSFKYRRFKDEERDAHPNNQSAINRIPRRHRAMTHLFWLSGDYCRCVDSGKHLNVLIHV